MSVNIEKNAACIMVQGCTSDAGKSVLAAAICRVFAKRNVKVAPFKPQNMALNSAVTPDGGEIGRAQAVQAQAAGIETSVHFNPVLLKPNSDTGSQVILQGKALSSMEAASYQNYKKVAGQTVIDSFAKLNQAYELIVVEGAGSPAEINLRKGDIANMGFAEAADCPVIIVADIDRGGVFAHLVGTLELLSESEQARVVGFVINRFRGDIGLLKSGLDWLEAKTNKPVLGVLPFLHGLDIAAEDAVQTQQVKTDAKVKVVVPVYPRMSNHTDFDALRLHPEIELNFVRATGDLDGTGHVRTPLPACDLIILPGSKSVRQDLAFLQRQGWDKDIAKHLRYGGKVWGICGGYQMLGTEIDDPLGIEGQSGTSQALGYLTMRTELAEQKRLANVEGRLTMAGETIDVAGYEIHAGLSQSKDKSQLAPVVLCEPFSQTEQADGLIDENDQIAGSYLHGIFDKPQAIQLIMKWLGQDVLLDTDHFTKQEQAIERIANACEQYLDIDRLWDIAQMYQNNGIAIESIKAD
ncbi:cobyric acid synthase [Catenovulum sp. SM1970]|uniref:cobyric acid synthase n=1 Tax=Marinifaba aquimaris TaxID=2741323 RepID=UPI001573AE27|nr:cobyric acid synthase [Marinifaba aquimaris]NTS77768.1 cobyric acid synthase [Marinifaba aquimaris]